MEAELFKLVAAAAAHLHMRDFKKVNKVPQTYNSKTFLLDGQTNLDISYIKMDTCVELLLSDGVCRKLGIMSYHPDIISAKDE